MRRLLRRGPGRTALALLAVPAALAFLTESAPLLANGGTLRVSAAPVGAYRVTVYTDPTPPRPDSVDVSVLVLRPGDPEPVDGLDIVLVARLVEPEEPRERADPIRVAATRDQADDPRYYAAKFRPGAAGRWRFTVDVLGPGGDGSVGFEVAVREPGPLERPGVVLVLALLPLLLLGGWLFRSAPDGPEPGTAGPGRPGDSGVSPPGRAGG